MQTPRKHRSALRKSSSNDSCLLLLSLLMAIALSWLAGLNTTRKWIDWLSPSTDVQRTMLGTWNDAEGTMRRK